MQAKSWFARMPGESRPFQLYCFPYAGGGRGSFTSWNREIAGHVEVCPLELPGRGARFHEAPYSAFSKMIEDLTDAFCQQRARNFAFFGHSLGGLMAFELARRLRDRHAPMPTHLFISGCAAARSRSQVSWDYLEGDAGLIQKLRALNGTPPELLENAELMELLLPAIRADFQLVASYQYAPGPLLDVPLTVLAGQADHIAPEQVFDWQHETSVDLEVRWLEGDHFFIQSERSSVISCINSTLVPMAAVSGGSNNAE